MAEWTMDYNPERSPTNMGVGMYAIFKDGVPVLGCWNKTSADGLQRALQSLENRGLIGDPSIAEAEAAMLRGRIKKAKRALKGKDASGQAD